jgi:hypothetical protein
LARKDAAAAVGSLRALDANLKKTSRDLNTRGDVPVWVHEEAEAENFWRNHKWMLRSQTELVQAVDRETGKSRSIGPERDLSPASALPWNARPISLPTRAAGARRALQHDSHVVNWQKFCRAHSAEEHVRVWRRRVAHKTWLKSSRGTGFKDTNPSQRWSGPPLPGPKLERQWRIESRAIWKNYGTLLERYLAKKERE